MPTAPRGSKSEPSLPLEQDRQARLRSRWFHCALVLSLVIGLVAYAPVGLPPVGGSSWWWPFGGSEEAPTQEPVDIAVGDGTADMDAGWDVEVPEAPGAVDVDDPSLEPIEFDIPEIAPQPLDLQMTDQDIPTGYVEGYSRERPSERTETTTVFDNPDGTKTLRVYQSPAFVETDDGAYVPIDPTLEEAGGGRWVPEAAADLSFAAEAAASDIIRFGIGGGQVAYGLSGADNVDAQVDGHQVVYEQILPETDLRFTVAGWGAKADIVLNGPAAATSWVFPLQLDGLSAAVDEASGAVHFVDADGAVVGIVPPGFAEDADIDPATGEGDRTYDLRYEVIDVDDTPALRVSLDQAWFDDADRVFPITVDPTLSESNGVTSGDTYVMKPYYNNYSGEGEIKVGTVDGQIAAGLLKFNTSMNALDDKYIRGATLNLYNTYSWSCADRKVKIHRITESWSVPSSKSWPGPSFDSTPVASKTFAHGYSGCGRAWESFKLDPWQMTQWVHGQESFYGFRVEASHTDEKGWKKFASRNSSIPKAAPFIDVVYANQGAKYSLPDGGFSSPVTAASAGTLRVKATNWGSATWQAGTGYQMRVKVFDLDGNSVRASEGPFYAPTNVGPHQSAVFTTTVNPLPPGTYKLRISMVDPQGRWFTKKPYYLPITTAKFKVVNSSPYIGGNSPGHGASVGSTEPTLWVKFTDPDNSASAATFRYRICRGPSGDITDCQASGWQSSAAWKVPADFLTWGDQVHWYAQVSDGTATSEWTPGIAVTPLPEQPPVTSHLAGAADGSTVPGLNPQVGNFTTTVTDAQVAAVGPRLATVRTYNSQDLRTDGAFGTGWSTPWDQRLVVEAESTVLVVLESGRTVRFGQNPDGTFASPLGETLELSTTASGYMLRNTAGQTREFNTAGQLVRITDAFGRGQSLTYASGQLTRVTDEASGRHLDLTWTGGHITAVETAPATAGGDPARWTYTYNGDLLVKACSPLSTLDCETYEYEATSFYEAAVQDANPTAYFTFDELSAGASLTNRAADIEGEDDGDKTGLLFTPVGGALASSNGQGIDLGADPETLAQLPDAILGGSVTTGIELWFRAEPDEQGMLLSTQSRDDGTASPSCFTPLLYVGPSGNLRSSFRMDSGSPDSQQFVTAAPVDDGQWHHVVLTSAATQQWLYVDGALVGTETGRTIDQSTCDKALVGNGWGTSVWPGLPNSGAYYPYNGEIDDLSLYPRTLTAEEIGQRYQAGRYATARMTGVVNDHAHTVWDIGYDRSTGRVETLTDVNGAEWHLSGAQLTDTLRHVTLSSSFGKTEQYDYDATHNGRIVSRTDGIGTVRWEYNSAGFVAEHHDETGLVRAFATDDKGRRLAETVCRAEGDCYTSYTEYYSATDPFDLRDGRVVWQSDGRATGREDAAYRTEYAYNSNGQLLTTTFPGTVGDASNPGGQTAYTYTTGTEAAVGGGTVPAGLTATVTDEAGAQTSYAYNQAGDLVETIAPSGQVTRYGHDLLGRVISTATGHYDNGVFVQRDATTYTLNALGRTTASDGTAYTNPVTGTEHRLQQHYTYNQFGRLDFQSTWDTADPAQVRTTDYTYDAAGRLIETTYPDGSVAAQQWDETGRTSQETTPTGLELAYTYDERARLVTTTAVGAGVDPADPAATELLVEYRTYYDNDWPASTTDAAGRTTAWEYWGDGHLHRELHRFDGIETVMAEHAYDNAGNAISSTDPVGTVTATAYNARNWPTATTTDPAGIAASQTFAYDQAGRSTEITHRYGGGTYQRQLFAYNTAGNLTDTWTTAPAVEGACTTDAGHSCVVSKTHHTWDGEGLLASSAIGTDGAETYTYNHQGQIESTAGAAREVWTDGVSGGQQQPVTTYGYNAFGEPTHLQDANGNVTETRYDTSGRPVETLLPAETVPGATAPVRPQITTAYRPGGLVASETDPRGAVTAYEYDLYGRTTSATQPDPDGAGAATAPTFNYAYDRVGQLIEQTDPNGAVSTMTYDGFGRLATSTEAERTDTGPAYFTTTFGYDTAGRLTATTAPAGQQTTYTYDALGRAATVTDPAGAVTTTDYPSALETVVNLPNGGDGTARRQYAKHDVLGNPVTETSEVNTTGTWESVQCGQARYDLSGRPVAATTIQRQTCTGGLDTTYEYDSAGQLTAVNGTVTDTSTITVALGYDGAGNRTRMVDGNGNATVYGFNSWGLQTTTVEPATAAHPDAADRTWTTAYDIAGNPVEQHLPGGVTQTAEYDLLGRKTKETGTGAEAATSIKYFTWDAVGNLASFSGDTGTTTLAYNDRGLLTGITGAQATSYAYNANSQVIERTDAAGTTGFGYDGAGRLDSLTDPLTGLTHTYQWRPDGQLGSITAGQTTRAFTYGGFGQLTGDQLTVAGTEQSSIDYAYDGQLLTAKTVTGLPNAGTHSYDYDRQGRLTSWTGTDGVETTYAWDGNSNRIAVHRWDTECGTQAADTRLYAYDERNRLTAAQDGTVQCVQNGEIWEAQTVATTPDETWTYTPRGTTANHQDATSSTVYAFDAFERLKTATVDGSTVANLYDALDRLVSRNGAAFTYDGLTNDPTTMPASTTGTDTVVRDPAGNPVSQTHNGTTGLTWTDQHGDLVATIAPDTGTLIAGGGFDPFGEPLPDTTATGLGFQGGYTDPTTGEVNAHARWYDPATGNFTSRDTWQLQPHPVTQTNRYLYAGASPLNYIDPSGHQLQRLLDGGGGGPITSGRTGVPIGAGGAPRGTNLNGTSAGTGKGALGLLLTWAGLEHLISEWDGSGSPSPTDSDAPSTAGSSSPSGIASTTDLGSGTLYCTYAGNCWVEPNGTDYSTEDDPSPNDDDGNHGGDDGAPGNGNGSGDGFNISIWIDWNAAKTRPTGTAQDAADDAPSQIDLLNDALMANQELIAALEATNIITVDEEGSIVAINWRDPNEDCASTYFYGPAPNAKASGAAAYLCGKNLEDQGPGSEANHTIPLWGWSEGGPNEDIGSPINYMYDRCHLVGRQLGGTGDSARNLVTCFGYPMNRQDMRQMIETPVRKQVEQKGEDVVYISVPQYGAGGTLSGIRIVAFGNLGTFEDLCFENKLGWADILDGTNC